MRQRARFIPFACLVVLMGAAIAIGSDESRVIRLRHALVAAYSLLLPQPTGLNDLALIRRVDGNPTGVNVFLEQEVEEWKIRRSLQLIQSAGFGWIRQQMLWAEIEPDAPGRFVDRATGGSSWEKYDRIVRLAREHGLRVLFRVDTSPAWARASSSKLESPPDDVEQFGRFVGLVADRYRGQIEYVQIWNEPNLPYEWGDRAPDAAAYTRMLEAARLHARRANIDIKIVSAALAPTTEFSEKGRNDLLYLQEMYDAGARHAFDVLGANAYGLRSGPDDRRFALDRDVNFSRPVLTRQVMVRNGDSSKPIWAAEVGWNALPEDWPSKSLWGRVDRATQASYTARAIERARSEWPWLDGAFIWHFRIVAPEGRQLQQYYFNMVDDAFEPLPVYGAVQRVLTSPRIAGRGARSQDDAAVWYDDYWSATNDGRAEGGSYRRATEAGATARLRFRGSDLAIQVGGIPGRGRIAWLVDGGVARGEWTSASDQERFSAPLSVATGLADGVHVLDVVALEPDTRLDGFVVDQALGWPGNEASTALLIGGIAVILVSIGVGHRAG